MSSDSESEVVVAGSSAEDIVQREKVKRSSGWEHFQENDDTTAERTHCHHEFKTKYVKTVWFPHPRPISSSLVSHFNILGPVVATNHGHASFVAKKLENGIGSGEI
ncbi:hypothetical protein QLX08_003697 [Tetragonisca angustula]|uniref:Uncharacterized protein n=1 Tax=Tetragonisca angustula TaxID=166442 RepID=A0AAW1A5W1_9HYME